jgi:hypothetical protein
MKQLESLDVIIRRNEELVAQMDQCPVGDMAALLEIQRELKRNNREILEWANNMGRTSKHG